MAAKGPVCEALGLVKIYGDRRVVDDVGFRIDAGEVYGLLGPNGAGKSTTIAMIIGLLKRDAGDVRICGIDIGAGASARVHIGYVPQDIALYPDLTGRENLRFWGHMYDIHGAELKRRIDFLLDTVGLADRGDERVDAYSGGMKRRINIAAGLLHSPDLLVLDEPTVGVDPQSRDSILSHVEMLNAEGLSVLYTTHYMEEAERLCDRVGIIDDGKLISEGTQRELTALTGDEDRIILAFDPGADIRAAMADAKTVDGVRDAGPAEGGVQVLAKDGRRVLPNLVETLVEAGFPIASVEVQEPNLEAVFLHLTGKALRD